jgi:plasmid stabilization system protein ParE
MSQVKLSDQATKDLGRFADFLIQAGVPHKAEEAISTILTAFKVLVSNPLIGKPYPLDEYDTFHELVIKYGKSGYVALYSFDEKADLAVIHAIRHQKEVGYKE